MLFNASASNSSMSTAAATIAVVVEAAAPTCHTADTCFLVSS